MEENYNKRELDHFMNEFDKRMTHQDDMLGEIKIQTLKTNGRVSKHDWYFKTLWWGLGILGTILLLTAGKIITFVSHVYELDREISQITTNYDITVGK